MSAIMLLTKVFLVITVAIQNCLMTSASPDNVKVVVYKTCPTTLNSKFLSVTLPMGIFNETAAMRKDYLFRSEKIQTLAKGLSPCYVRMGGTSEDFAYFALNSPAKSRSTTLKFRPQSQHNDMDAYLTKKDYKKFVFTAKQWDELNAFVKTVKWDVVFGLNAFTRDSQGNWDPTNAMKLLNYTESKKYEVAGWELGNEPNDFKKFGQDISGTQLAIDYTQLRNSVLLKYNLPGSKNFRFIGPSVTQLSRKSAKKYFTEFLEHGGGNMVTNPSFHQYYINARDATIKNLTDPAILDKLLPEILTGNDISFYEGGGKKMWLGETGSCSGGGLKGASDRYIAGFMWLDKLGIAGINGIDVVVRQSFYSGRYGLIDFDSTEPNPDYWLSLLFKTLVGKKTVKITNSDKTGYVRTYAYCTKTTEYVSGSVTLTVMNLKNHTVMISSPQFGSSDVHVYLMEPVNGDVTSKQVNLNGQLMKMVSDTELPKLTRYLSIQTGPVAWPAYTYGFIVIPNAKVNAC